MGAVRKNPKKFRAMGEITLEFYPIRDKKTGIAIGKSQKKVISSAKNFRCDKNGHLVLATHYKRKDKKLESYSSIPEIS